MAGINNGSDSWELSRYLEKAGPGGAVMSLPGSLDEKVTMETVESQESALSYTGEEDSSIITAIVVVATTASKLRFIIIWFFTISS